MKEEPIRIQMFGGFRISLGENSIGELNKRAPKFWRMLEYLITFRHKSISYEELISAMWPESDNGDPRSSMRNMVFRIRAALVSSGIPYAKDMILHNGEGYSWNNDLDCEVDFEEFEKLYHQACAAETPEEIKLEKIKQAIDLYKGDFLPNSSCEMWVMPLESYYRSLFFKCVYIALELLMRWERYAEAELICKKALFIDQFDEKTHEYHLLSLIRQEKQTTALTEYQKMSTLFYEELGVSPSEALSSLYLDIQKMTVSSEHTLDDLTKEWIQQADYPGAFYCDYGVFKIMYQHEARSVERSGKSIYVISVVLSDDAKKSRKADSVMPHLQDVIQRSLRKGDVFTRTSPHQYILLLQGLTNENCKMISKKILREYNKKHRAYPLNISSRQITPIS